MNTKSLLRRFWLAVKGKRFFFVFSFKSSIMNFATKAKSPRHVTREIWSRSDYQHLLEFDTVNSGREMVDYLRTTA